MTKKALDSIYYDIKKVNNSLKKIHNACGNTIIGKPVTGINISFKYCKICRNAQFVSCFNIAVIRKFSVPTSFYITVFC